MSSVALSDEGAPLFEAIARAAAEALGAVGVTVVADEDGQLRVIGAAGSSPPYAPGSLIPPSSAVGFVVASGQPLTAQDGETVVAAPCLNQDGVLGAIEIRAAADAHDFTPEDQQLVVLFAEIVAQAIAYRETPRQTLPLPTELGADLARLAELNPGRYRQVASALGMLLANA